MSLEECCWRHLLYFGCNAQRSGKISTAIVLLLVCGEIMTKIQLRFQKFKKY